MDANTCSLCGARFSLSWNLSRHMRTTHGTSLQCEQCQKRFSRGDSLRRHIATHHPSGVPAKHARIQPQLPQLPASDAPFYSLGNTMGPYEQLYRKHWNVIRTHYFSTRVDKRYNYRVQPGESDCVPFLEAVFASQKHPSKWDIEVGMILEHKFTGEYWYFYASYNTSMLKKPKMVRHRADFEELLKELEGEDPNWLKVKPSSQYQFDRLANVTVVVATADIGSPMVGAPYDEMEAEEGEEDPHLDAIREYIHNSNSIRKLTTTRAGEAQQDNLCFFRCLASSKVAASARVQMETRRLFGEWAAHKDLNPHYRHFAGVNPMDLEELEDFFRVDVYVFELSGGNLIDEEPLDLNEEAVRLEEEDPEGAARRRNRQLEEIFQGAAEQGWIDHDETALSLESEVSELSEQEEPEEQHLQAKLVRRSLGKYCNPLNLLLFMSHFHLITNLSRLCRRWRCEKCDRLINHYGTYKRHALTCDDSKKKIYPGNAFNVKRSVFHDLKRHGIEVEEQFYPYRAFYDFECLFNALEPRQDAGTQMLSTLVPASVSVVSNVPGSWGNRDFERPQFFLNRDPLKLITDFFEYLCAIADAAKARMMEQYRDLIDEVKEKARGLDATKRALRQAQTEQEKNKLKNKIWEVQQWSRLLQRLENFTNQLPVIGFNSGKFDLNLIKKYLLPLLIRRSVKVQSIIMRGNNFLSVSLENMQFLDIINYLAAGMNYDSWIKAYKPLGAPEPGKGFWPYEAFTSFEFLEQTTLPPKEAFTSTLRMTTMTDEEYEDVKRYWDALPEQTIKCLLEEYNNNDTVPGLNAIQTMYSEWKSQGIDMFKHGCISLPGLAMLRMFKDLDYILPLMPEKFKHWSHLFKDNIIGGPSIVFTRKHTRQTEIRGIAGNHPKAILGFDANSLYLTCTGKDMPYGFPIELNPGAEGEHVLPTEDEQIARPKMERNWNIILKAQHMVPWRQETYWILAEFYRMKRENPNLTLWHKFNGGQKRLNLDDGSRVWVDGFVPETNTVLEFMGCWWHGHRCPLGGQPQQQQIERYEKMVERHRKLAAAGYTVKSAWECEVLLDQEMDNYAAKYANGAHDMSVKSLIRKVERNEFFGAVECDLLVPKWEQALREQLAEFPPIFKNTEVRREDIGDFMRQFAEETDQLKKPRRALISSFYAEKMLVATPLLKKYLELGVVITRVYRAISFSKRKMFAGLVEDITKKRREAHADPSKKAMGETAKLCGNSCYGKTITDVDKHMDTMLLGQSDAIKAVNTARFRKVDFVDEGTYMVQCVKSRVRYDLPVYIGFFVYAYAKEALLSFYYDFLLEVVGRNNFELIQCDTDSLYFACNERTVEEASNAAKYRQLAEKFLVLRQEDEKTPGLWKLEWAGEAMVALNSKCYYGKGERKNKMSSKGLSHRTNRLTYEDYESVLDTRQPISGINRGFRPVNSELVRYDQRKRGLNYLYIKRVVQNDGVNTMPLEK